jgi:ribosomal-protein-alanine N-acetyltransferase
MSLVPRPVREIDLARLARLHALCFPEEAWDASSLASILDMPGANGRYLAAATGEAAGLLLELSLGEEAEILTFGIAPEFRHRGLGRLLLTDFIARARAQGVRRLVLEVAADNVAALALYRQSGFLTVGRRPHYYRRAAGPTIDAWQLSLPIEK